MYSSCVPSVSVGQQMGIRGVKKKTGRSKALVSSNTLARPEQGQKEPQLTGEEVAYERFLDIMESEHSEILRPWIGDLKEMQDEKDLKELEDSLTDEKIAKGWMEIRQAKQETEKQVDESRNLFMIGYDNMQKRKKYEQDKRKQRMGNRRRKKKDKGELTLEEFVAVVKSCDANVVPSTLTQTVRGKLR
eukprot:TRINITY_DN11511_c0_g2_i1.p1 TRINITY_DN11511_c0_g2~~TRINITY_DN11511_c0_g2_i1.p1  ORF type:complete len:222 (-),score=74.52 TRINITY_DN11511_c0_g2_i1:628-1194(-)